MVASILSQKKARPLLAPLTVSVVVTTFLCYIDEGYYNFDWIKDTKNWFAFFVYVGSFLLGQQLTVEVILAKYNGRLKSLLSYMLGFPFGFIIALLTSLIIGIISFAIR